MNSILAVVALVLCAAQAQKTADQDHETILIIQKGPTDVNANKGAKHNDNVIQRGLLDDWFKNDPFFNNNDFFGRHHGGRQQQRPQQPQQQQPDQQQQQPDQQQQPQQQQPSSGPVGCGKQATEPQLPTQRIIGGEEAVPHAWPWLAAFQVSLGGGMAAMCGANLIRVSDKVEESDILVTAAHCVTKEETQGSNPQAHPSDHVTIIAGIHNKGQREQGQQGSKAADLRFHPQFKFSPRGGANNDVAIVKLQRPVKFSDTVRPICLPDKGEAIPTGKTCVAAGWGRVDPNTHQTANALRQVVAPAQDAKTCAQAWGTKFQHAPGASDQCCEGWKAIETSYKEDQMICAGQMDGESGTCQGDSGGMLACKDGDKWKLYGTTSFGVAGTCLQRGKPGNFARISSYVDWINQNAQEMTSVGK